jgi:hypothetical protein
LGLRTYENLTENVGHTALGRKRNSLAIKQADHDACLMPVIKNEDCFAILIDQTRLPNAGLPGCTPERGVVTFNARDLCSAPSVQSEFNYSAGKRAISDTTLIIGNRCMRLGRC